MSTILRPFLSRLAAVSGLLAATVRRASEQVHLMLTAEVYFGKNPGRVPGRAVILFPCCNTVLCCGIAGMVSYKAPSSSPAPVDMARLDELVTRIENQDAEACRQLATAEVDRQFLGGRKLIESVDQTVQSLKCRDPFCTLFSNQKDRGRLAAAGRRLAAIADAQAGLLTEHMGRMDAQKVDLMAERIEKLRDIAWCIDSEIITNIKKIEALYTGGRDAPRPGALAVLKKINGVLNSLDRLEVRGRDSAGLSLLFVLDEAQYAAFEKTVKQDGHADQLQERCSKDTLVNRAVSINRRSGDARAESVAMALTYKVADEVGSLGDNIRFLRRQIANDPILQAIAACRLQFDTLSAHTRWASVGAITEANCHPVDNRTAAAGADCNAIIHTCLNGDIDNYLQLRKKLEAEGDRIPENITTDTKIIPLVIQSYIRQGHNVTEAFRLAVNSFEGSHAISMHTDLAPGKLFLAQRGSGQALFVGLARDHYMPTSEVYGFVEETPHYLKLDGEKTITGADGPVQGQIFILDQACEGGLTGIQAMYYDGSRLALTESDIKQTAITSRDIDRQHYPHYFLKEISESPASVEKTLQNRWKIDSRSNGHYIVSLDDSVITPAIRKALAGDRIKRIFFIGQGTAGVAALACANILDYYLDNPAYHISALKASELSGFQLHEHDGSRSMADTLVIAISQSGTTTDTNRTVEMVKQRGAHTLAIVNRRDSDITFKVDGVMYTSSGRDIEMSVASTKAFYSQIVAGALLGLYITTLKKRRNAEFVTREIKQLLELPAHMRSVLAMKDAIKASAEKLAVTKTYWAAVGSGPNKASADEIRIKLSELCYKTISSDFVEDKKHIDLSSEPLIIICAAGTRSTVIGDIIKDTAIFKAHKATPIVIADRGEDRFNAYAETVLHVPPVSEHLAPVLNTLVGHIWGYYAALAINQGSRFLYEFQEEIKKTVEDYTRAGLDVYEIILEKTFREKIAEFYGVFRKKRSARQLPPAVGTHTVSDLALLLKYLSGRLPVSDFELDFNCKGTAVNMLNTLFSYLAEAISAMARPVDAIKHQAKTVTVGTSRIRERLEGILFDVLSKERFAISQLTNNNVIVLKNLQHVIARIEGATLYRIGGLDALGEPSENTTIEVVSKHGAAAAVPSRVETDNRLKGTKRIIVKQGNVYIGKGRKDERSILVIPVLSASDTAAGRIEYLLLLHIGFKKTVPLETRLKALGGKYEHIKNIVQENSIAWDDRFLELLEIEELFGRSAEKIGEFIVQQQNGSP